MPRAFHSRTSQGTKDWCSKEVWHPIWENDSTLWRLGIESSQLRKRCSGKGSFGPLPIHNIHLSINKIRIIVKEILGHLFWLEWIENRPGNKYPYPTQTHWQKKPFWIGSLASSLFYPCFSSWHCIPSCPPSTDHCISLSLLYNILPYFFHICAPLLDSYLL